MNQKKGMSGVSKVFIIAVVMLIVIGMCSCGSNSEHAPGYGSTSKCTICGKTATHHSTNYGFCNKHWEDATR